ALRRFVGGAERPAPGERCEMCTEPIASEHAHVVNVEARILLCTCRACYLLFTRPGAAQGRYRAVPDRALRLADLPLAEAQWDALQIPVRMAFLFHNSALGRTVAFYPSPAGATESLLPLEAWRELADGNPVLGTLEHDVEALLVRGSRDPGAGFECFLVPIDACYALTGVVRRRWRGFAGGEAAWGEIAGVYAELCARRRGGAMSAAPPP